MSEVLLVVGGAWLGVARLPRVLAAAGCRVVLLCHPNRFAARTRFVHECIPAPGDAAGTVAALRKLLARRTFDWVILGDDLVLEECIRVGGDWRSSFFPVPLKGDKPHRLISKVAFAAALEGSRVPFPTTIAATGPEEALRAAERIGYPVIVKPDRGSAGDGVFRADDATTMQRVAAGASVVVQRFLVGKVGSTAILYDCGRPLSWISSFKEGVYPEPFGPSCVRRYVHFPGMEALLAALGARIEMTGICGADWILEEGATLPLILELNGRPTPWIHLYREFGTDFPEAIRALVEKSPIVVRPRAQAPVPDIHMFPQNAFRAVSQGDWGGFLRAYFGRDGPNDLPRDDAPLRRAFRRYLRQRALSRLRYVLNPLRAWRARSRGAASAPTEA